MTASTEAAGRPDYGLDAPPVVRVFAVVAVAGAVILVGGLLLTSAVAPAWWPAALIGIVPLALGALTVIAMVRSSRVGKIRLRDRLLDELAWRGDEDVLDLGCGRGLMLLGAAQRAPRGTATGIDLWRAEDQGGNTRDNCLENARRLGLENRIRLVDGDMARLPMPDDSFDLVTAVLAVHNISERSARAATLREAARVLRPGGRILLIDFSRTEEYAQDATEAGLAEVRRSAKYYSMYPFVRVVTALVPDPGDGADDH